MSFPPRDEAAAKLAELREQEQSLTIELSTISQKAQILEDWQKALEWIKGRGINQTLTELAEKNPIVFRQILGIIFEPNSIKVRTQKKGKKLWQGFVEDYKLTEAIRQKQDYTFYEQTFHNVSINLS